MNSMEKVIVLFEAQLLGKNTIWWARARKNKYQAQKRERN